MRSALFPSGHNDSVAHNRPFFCSTCAWSVFPIWARTGKSDLLIQTIVVQQIVDEFAPVIRIDPQQGEKGNFWRIRWIASQTACCVRCGRALSAIQPVQMSVQVKVFKYCPAVVFPQCRTEIRFPWIQVVLRPRLWRCGLELGFSAGLPAWWYSNHAATGCGQNANTIDAGGTDFQE